MKRLGILVPVLFILIGCSRVATPPPPLARPSAVPSPAAAVTTPVAPAPAPTVAVMLPMTGYRERRTVKVYGQYVQDRFTGYHTGDDVEYADVAGEVPVLAIADGEVVAARQAGGYGGMMVVAHAIGGKTVSALYGHLDLKSAKLVGAQVKGGEPIAVLGDHESMETDGERKHLHFHLWEGGGERISGYAKTLPLLADYLNPTDFFAAHGQDVTPPARHISYSGVGGSVAPHPTFAGVSFQLPAAWAVEYVPQIQALNLFTLAGVGSARERSQIFIRTFTADRFLTLGTITIQQTQDGQINSSATRRYDIEKKPGVPDFPHQPSWRNLRHIVTDFRANPGRSIFYVVAQNPSLDDKIYTNFLHRLGFGQP